MPSAGAFDFPSRDLDDCLSYLRTARDKLGSRSMTRKNFAHAIVQSEKGGGFGKLVGAMAAYGLVETGRGKIATTEVGEQILYGNPDDQRRGREQSVKNVPLFDELLTRYGGVPTDEQLRIFLRERAGLDIATAKVVSAEVGKLLRRNSVHFPASQRSRTQTDESPAGKSMGELVGRLEMSDYGILNIRDEISMDLAIDLLAHVKKNKGWGGPGRFREGRNRARIRKEPRQLRPGRATAQGSAKRART